MSEYTCVCYGNRTLKYIQTNISFDWYDKFVGRKIIREQYDQLFDHNGFYLENEDYDLAAITVNMTVIIDDEGYLKDVTASKYQDLYFGHGRPVTRDKRLTKSDYKALAHVLDHITEDHISDELNSLYAKLLKNTVLLNEYSVKSSTKSDIKLSDKDGKTVSIPKAEIERALIVSYRFIDVLFCEETLVEAANIFPKSDVRALLAILSMVDYQKYRNIDKLLEEATLRSLIRSSINGYPALVAAAERNDMDGVREYPEFARLVNINSTLQYTPPLFSAIRHDNIDMIQLLLKKGAYSAEVRLYDDHQQTTPLLLAFQQKNDLVVNLILEHHGAEPDSSNGSCLGYNRTHRFEISDIFDYLLSLNDFESFKRLLSYAPGYVFRAARLNDADINTVSELANIKNARIDWTLKYVLMMYENDKSICSEMLKQGCTLDVVDHFIQMNDFEMFSLSLTRHKVISPNKSFNMIYQREKKWYEKLREHSNPENNYSALRHHRDYFLSNFIKEKHYDKYIEITNNLEIGVPVASFVGFVNYPNNTHADQELNDFLSFVLNHVNHTDLMLKGQSKIYTDFYYFANVVLVTGTCELCTELLTKFHDQLSVDDRFFTEVSKRIMINRDDSIFDELVKARLNLNVDEETKYRGIWEVLEAIIRSFSFREKGLSSDYLNEHHGDEYRNELSKYLIALRQLGKLISIDSVTSAMLNQRRRQHPETQTILEYAEKMGITNIAFLEAIKSIGE